MTDTRYPYTYSVDYIRMSIPYRDSSGCVLSRSEASQIRQAIADAIHFDDKILAEMLADKFLENENNICEKRAEQFINILKNKTQ